jgi:tetratricopeptide (TPR) repeat protein
LNKENDAVKHIWVAGLVLILCAVMCGGEILASDPVDADALFRRAESFREAGALADAHTDYVTLSQLVPDDPTPWFWLGTLERWQGQHDVAISNYARCLDVASCHSGALKGRARIFIARKDFDAAIADLRQAVTCAPDDDEALGLLAETHARAGDSATAERVLTERFEGAELQRRLAGIALLMDRDDEALNHYRQAVVLDPHDRDSNYWVGVLEGRAGRFQASLDAYERILADDPGHAGAAVGKARLLRADGRVPEALELVDGVLAADPENGEARTLRASMLGHAGRREEARRELDRVLAAQPDDADACLSLEQQGGRRYVDLDGAFNQSDVIEIPDLANPAVFTNIRYLNNSLGGEYGHELVEGHALRASVHWGREAVINLDADADVYDFDVFRSAAGFDHRLTDRFRFNWRVGNVGYDSRSAGTIDTTDRFEGSAELAYYTLVSRLAVTFARSAFIQRGFAADFQFRIFDQDQLSLAYNRALHRGYSLAATAGVSEFDDGNSIEQASVALHRQRENRNWILRLRHQPFPARYLTVPDRNLEIIDYTDVSIYGRFSLPRGFGASGELLFGRYAASDPGEDSTLRTMLRGDLYWQSSRVDPLLLGVGGLHDDFDNLDDDFNANSTDAWFFYVQLGDDLYARWSYRVRYTRSLSDDLRASSFWGDDLQARFERILGCGGRPAGALRFGAEARWAENELGEDRQHIRLFLTAPF